ncbi:Mur ligase family protein [Microbacterium sp.]|uniref:Mur ligase family protein n=1 Tax=Microbacterium sp. TaxID=51671 RepID=UPI0039E6442D
MLRPEHPPRRRLADLVARLGTSSGVQLHGVAHPGDADDVVLTGITLATGDLRPGDVFVGIRGVREHGARFAADAVARGAVAIVTDEAGAAIAADAGVPIVVVDDPRARLADLAAWVYGNDEAMPVLLGVTGTNGKTSTVHLQDALLQQLGIPSGMSSSARRHIDGDVIMARLTTPESTELHALIAHMKERGVRAVALEVSVQAIVRHRVDGVVYDVAGFTNLQYDHMDDFADMDEYLAGKLQMFRSDRARRAVVSLDTPAGRAVVDHADIPVVTIATPQIAVDPDLAATAQWTVHMPEEAINASRMALSGPDGRYLETTVPVTGPHMVANAGLAIVMILEAGLATWDEIVAVLERDGGIRGVLPGRTEIVTTGRGPTVYLDFAHTPDGFEMTAQAVRRQTPGTLLIMFGADGSRDTTKRPAMGLAAARNSDIAIVTDHHPRWEDAAVIRDGLYSGAVQAPPPGGLYNITPPEDAIVKAVSLVGEGDAILWFGPGHQDHREIRGVRHPYNPRQLALDALHDAGW